MNTGTYKRGQAVLALWHTFAGPFLVANAVVPSAFARRVGDVSVQMHRPMRRFHRVQLFAHFRAEKKSEPVEQTCGRGNLIDFLAVVP